MLWVDAEKVRLMSDLGYMPRSSDWYITDERGNRVNGYFIPPGRAEEVKRELCRRGVYHHE